MRHFFFVLFVLVSCNTSFSQIPSWNNTKDWKLYNISQPEQFNIPVDSMGHFRYILLNDDSMINFVRDVTLIPELKKPVWMGFYIVSYQDKNAVTEKMEVGQYGGYFYDEKTKKYYQLPVELRKNWLSYLSMKSALVNQ